MPLWYVVIRITTDTGGWTADQSANDRSDQPGTSSANRSLKRCRSTGCGFIGMSALQPCRTAAADDAAAGTPAETHARGFPDLAASAWESTRMSRCAPSRLALLYHFGAQALVSAQEPGPSSVSCSPSPSRPRGRPRWPEHGITDIERPSACRRSGALPDSGMITRR